MKGPSFICAILDGYDSQRSCAAIGNGVEQKPFDPATSLHRAKTRTYSFPFSRLLFDWSSGASGSPLIDISCTRINKCFLEAPEVSGEDFEATRVHRAPRSGNPTVRCTRRASARPHSIRHLGTRHQFGRTPATSESSQTLSFDLCEARPKNGNDGSILPILRIAAT